MSYETLLGLSKEFPFLIYKGKIFELTNKSGSDIIWKSDFGEYSFEESENIKDIEKRNLESQVLSELEKEKIKIINEKKELESQNTNLDSKMDQLIIKFLSDNIPEVEEELKKQLVPSSSELDKLTKFNDNISISRIQNNNSLFEQFNSETAIIFNNHYLKLSNKNSGFGSIQIGHNKYYLKLEGTAKNLFQKYQTYIDHKIKEFIKHETKDKLETIIKIKNQVNNNTYKLGEHNGLGVVKKGNKTFFYVTIEDINIITYEFNPRRKYKFPSCKVAFEVSEKKGVFHYETPVVILEAKAPDGSFKNMKGKDYVFPATSSSIDENQYQGLCIMGENFSYKNNDSKDIRLFDNAIRSHLRTAKNAMSNGYYKKNGKIAYIYRKIGSNEKLYEEFRVE